MKKVLVIMLIILFVNGCGLITTQETTTVDFSSTIQNSTEITTEDIIWRYDSEYEVSIFNWIKDQQLPNGLHPSTEDGEMLSLYDNALAALVYIMYGDYSRAELLFDFFEDRIEMELNDEYGGFAQFRDANGNILGGAIGRRWLGDNAWLLLALNAYHKKTQTQTYSDLADDLNFWIRSLQQENGSLMSGYDEDGLMMSPVTEAMIDSYNAVLGFDGFHSNLLDYLELNRYDAINNVLVSWPENPQYTYALDLSSWGYLGMNYMPYSVLEFANLKFRLIENEITGYNIDEDKDAIWPEMSLQMATAFIKAGDYSQGSFIINEMEKLYMVSDSDDSTGGLPYASRRGTMYGDLLLWEEANTEICMSSSAWYLFAVNGYNPFEAGLFDKEPANVVDELFYNH